MSQRKGDDNESVPFAPISGADIFSYVLSVIVSKRSERKKREVCFLSSQFFTSFLWPLVLNLIPYWLQNGITTAGAISPIRLYLVVVSILSMEMRVSICICECRTLSSFRSKREEKKRFVFLFFVQNCQLQGTWTSPPHNSTNDFENKRGFNEVCHKWASVLSWSVF